MFVRDYWENKSDIMCKLLKNHSLAVDDQHKVVKWTFIVVGHVAQTFTICSDFSLTYLWTVCHGWSDWWTQVCWSGITQISLYGLYMLQWHAKLSLIDMGTSVAASWWSTFLVKLDTMHLRIGKEMNTPATKTFWLTWSTQSSCSTKVIYWSWCKQGKLLDLKDLLHTQREWSLSVELSMTQQNAWSIPTELDSQCHSQAEAAGMEVDNLTVADIAYTLITKRVTGVFQQLFHFCNGWREPTVKENLPYVKVGILAIS